MELDFNFTYNKTLLHEKLKRFKDISEKKPTIKETNDTYSNNSEGFTQEIKNSNFIQYAHLYFIRLAEIKNTMHKIASSKWNNIKICKNILDVKGNVRYFNPGNTSNNRSNLQRDAIEAIYFKRS